MGRSENISPAGVLIRAARLFAAGTPVEVMMTVPAGILPNIAGELLFVGCVARILPAAWSGGIPGVAIAFQHYQTVAPQQPASAPQKLAAAPQEPAVAPQEPASASLSSALEAPTPSIILVVDDDQVTTAVLADLFGRQSYTVNIARDGRSALDSIAKDPPDVILLDIVLPGLDGVEICRQIKREPASRLTPIILMTASSTKERRIAALQAGADEIVAKPVDPEELLTRVGALARVKRYTDDLDAASSIVMTLAVMVESRDGHREGHCHRIANYATALGRDLPLSAKDLQALHRAGFLHDIGMLAVPEVVLRKSGRLNPEEYELMKSHTIVGDSLVEGLRSLQAVRPIIKYHHERLDGSGYPDGLQGDAIPLLAQIIGLVDIFDAVTTQRPYQDAKTVEQAIAVLMEQVDRGWQRRDLVERFAALIQTGKIAV